MEFSNSFRKNVSPFSFKHCPFVRAEIKVCKSSFGFLDLQYWKDKIRQNFSYLAVLKSVVQSNIIFCFAWKKETVNCFQRIRAF